MIHLAWTPERIAAFLPVCTSDPFGPLQTPEELLFGSDLFGYEQGEQGALVALRREVFASGVRVHIQAMVTTTPGKLQTRHLMQAIEDTADNLGADFLTLCTPHPQIIDGAKRWGACVTGAIVVKQLKAK